MSQRYLGGEHEVINNEQYTSNIYIRYLNEIENNESSNIIMTKNQEYGGHGEIEQGIESHLLGCKAQLH